jgi:hypothetical protein
MQSEVDAYLADLTRRLPAGPLRRRFLEEARAHIDDAGLEAFGPVGVVAARMRGELARTVDRLAPRAVFALVALFAAPLYVIPENTLPAAPWAETPAQLAWKVTAANWAFALAVALGFVAVVAWGGVRRAALFAAVAALAASAVVALPLAWQWPVGSGAIAGAVAAARLALVVAAAVAVGMRETVCAPRR